MRKLLVILPVLTLSLLPSESDSRPVFPVTLEVEYGIGDGIRRDMDVTVEGDRTFVDSDRDAGVWTYRPRDGMLLLRYEGDAAGFDLLGEQDASCFSGSVYFEEEVIDTWSGCVR